MSGCVCFRGVVADVRREPPFGFGDAHAFSFSEGFDLVACDFADGEIFRFGMREIKSADRGSWKHGIAFGQFEADAIFEVE